MPTSHDFNETEVSWSVDDIDVHATLTIPTGAGPFPALIMVAGSGPTDRNWNSPLIPGANGSAALLAQALGKQGFVTLRYDKRASGPHARENVARLTGRISMQGHQDELTGGKRFLAERNDVDANRIFILGNSEGCLHALIYQIHAQTTGHPFAGLILTAAFARPAGELAHAQIAAQLAAAPAGDKILAVYDAAMADFTAGRPVNADDTLPPPFRNLILSVTNPVNQPFAHELWVADPLALLAEVRAPVLIIIGKKDIQVDWQVDGALFEPIAKTHRNISLVYTENANHVLKYEPHERAQLTLADVMKTYSGDDTRLDTETVNTIVAWLNTGHFLIRK